MLTLVPVVTEAVSHSRGLAPPVAGNVPLNVALLANGKANSVELLDAMARHLGEYLPVAEADKRRISDSSG